MPGWYSGMTRIFSGNSESGNNQPVIIPGWSPQDIYPVPEADTASKLFSSKNPACCLNPTKNGCESDDQLSLEQVRDLITFSSYLPFSHHKSADQKMPSIVSLLSWFSVISGCLIYYCFEMRLPILFRGSVGL